MEDNYKTETSNLTEPRSILDPGSSSEEDVMIDRIVVPIVFGVIFVIGLVGNGLLIFTVLANKSMRTIPNIFLTSLAIGDFFLILVSVPFRAALYIFDEWWFGEAMCKISEFVITLSLGTSVFTLTALTGDRFIAIVLPRSTLGWSTMRKTVLISILLWILSLILAAPDLITSTVAIYHNSSLYCSIYGESPTYDNLDSYWYYKFRPMFHFAVFFAIPLIVIATLNISIARVLLRKSSTPVGKAELSGAVPSWEKERKNRQKIAKMVLAIVIMFTICWTPRYLFIFLHRFKPDFEFNIYYHILKISGFCLSFIYSCVNPVTLYVASDEFRRHFNYYLFRCCRPSLRLPAPEHLHSVSLQDFIKPTDESMSPDTRWATI